MPEVSLVKPARLSHWLKLFLLYRNAFPASERKPFSIIVKMHHQGYSDVWCLESSGTFVGLAATINSDALVLLDYFAVEPSHRGKGIGSASMVQLLKHYSFRGVFAEIESTREHASNHTERMKRKQFYLNAGMEDLGVEAEVFGVRMELLGCRCKMDFEQYRMFYGEHYSRWAAQHIKQV